LKQWSEWCKNRLCHVQGSLLSLFAASRIEAALQEAKGADNDDVGLVNYVSVSTLSDSLDSFVRFVRSQLHSEKCQKFEILKWKLYQNTNT
jgi:hypothetical protein